MICVEDVKNKIAVLTNEINDVNIVRYLIYRRAVMYQDRIAGRCIGNLSNLIRRRLDSFSTKRGVSGSQGRVLHFILAQTDDIFQKDVELEFNLRPPSATQLLKLMEKNGLIRRESVSEDARLKKIIVTEKASALIGAVIPDLEEMERDLTRGITQEQLDVFFEVVERMTKNMGG